MEQIQETLLRCRQAKCEIRSDQLRGDLEKNGSRVRLVVIILAIIEHKEHKDALLLCSLCVLLQQTSLRRAAHEAGSAFYGD